MIHREQLLINVLVPFSFVYTRTLTKLWSIQHRFTPMIKRTQVFCGSQLKIDVQMSRVSGRLLSHFTSAIASSFFVSPFSKRSFPHPYSLHPNSLICLSSPSPPCLSFFFPFFPISTLVPDTIYFFRVGVPLSHLYWLFMSYFSLSLFHFWHQSKSSR